MQLSTLSCNKVRAYKVCESQYYYRNRLIYYLFIMNVLCIIIRCRVSRKRGRFLTFKYFSQIDQCLFQHANAVKMPWTRFICEKLITIIIIEVTLLYTIIVHIVRNYNKLTLPTTDRRRCP